jgi:capsular polysaccharide biosynthesis protein
VFAPARGVRRVGDFGARRVLFRQAMFSAPCYHSFLFAYLMSENERPERVGMLDAFSALVQRSFGVSPAAPRTAGPLRITFVSRRLYDTHAAATSASVRTSNRWIGRQVANEANCVEALTAIGDVDVRVVDFARHPLDEQIRIAHDTDLLIGAHGAGLTHLLCTPPHAGLLEIAPRPGPDWKAWRVFPNMALWTGRPHAVIDAPERAIDDGTELTVDVDQFARAARDVIAQVRTRGAIA